MEDSLISSVKKAAIIGGVKESLLVFDIAHRSAQSLRPLARPRIAHKLQMTRCGGEQCSPVS